VNITCTVCGARSLYLPGGVGSDAYRLAEVSGWRLRQTFGQWDAYCSTRCASAHGYAA
jgi:hypothetical protein